MTGFFVVLLSSHDIVIFVVFFHCQFLNAMCCGMTAMNKSKVC